MNGDGQSASGTPPRSLGVLVGGSLSQGLDVRLAYDRSIEDVAVGRYVTIQGERRRFFGLVTDVRLQTLHPGFATALPRPGDDFVRAVTSGVATYGVLAVAPYLTVDPLGPPAESIGPAKTVPSHFAEVSEATQEDVEMVFGRDDPSHFEIGAPLDMDVKLFLDYGKFVERSNGVFGKSGTGKTFLTRMLLASVVMKSNVQKEAGRSCVNLVFDMHNEYGWAGTRESGSGVVKALKQLFPASVAVFTLDADSSRRRGAVVDGTVEIGFHEVEPGDLAVLRETLNLSERAIEAAYELRRRYGQEGWLRGSLAIGIGGEEGGALLRELNIHEATFSNLQRGLRQLTHHDFLRDGTSGRAVDHILSQLLSGKNVVLEFGRYGDDLAAYMLVANLLSRRVHEEYRRRSEAALGDPSRQPPRLVITIEEAHKFLSPEVASQTIFGQIAREMRKYNVTLLVVDQRPSGIDAEVMSQLGTKIACLLDNQADVEAVLSGVSGSSHLRGVLARLESRQQALIFGHAVPMPVVVRTPDYGSAESYSRFQGGTGQSLKERLQDFYDED